MTYQYMIAVLRKFLPLPLRRLIGRVLVRIGLIKKGVPPAERLQRETIAALACRAQGEADAGEALLSRAFNGNLTTHPGLPREYLSDFIKAVEQRRSFTAHYDDAAGAILLEHTRSLDVSCLPCSTWILLHGACIRNGLFRASGIARDKAIEAAYEEALDQTAGADCLVQAFKAGVDQGEFERAEVFLDRLRSVDCHNSLLADLQAYYYLNTGDSGSLRAFSKDVFTKQDLAFAEYIAGKSIAIVGPAPSGQDVGAEIDSFDIVLRFNYRGRHFGGPVNEFGGRTDVSYYNLEAASELSHGESLGFLGDLRFAVFKSAEHRFQKHLLQSHRGRVFKWNRFHFAGSAMAIQNALFDLFRFGAQRVRLFQVNFFLSEESHHSGYAMSRVLEDTQRDRTHKTLMRWHTFAYHGLVNQLNFTRNLWKAGLVEAASSCEDVLRLTPIEYLAGMEQVWVINAINENVHHARHDASPGTRGAVC